MNVYVKVMLGLTGLAVAVLALPVLYYFAWHNWRTVEQGAFYGSRQMSGPALEKTIRKYGIKTVINLRGANPGVAWYDEEMAVCERAGVRFISFRWSKDSIPDPHSLAHLIHLMEKGDKPFLVHCEGGSHRTAIAAACYELLRGKGMDEARKQLGPMFRDAPIGQLLDLYEASNLPFRTWVLEVYPSVYERLKLSAEREFTGMDMAAALLMPHRLRA